MPRRRQLQEDSIRLWLETLPTWKRKVLETLASTEKPLTTGELLEAIDYQANINTLYNWLGRLEQKGLVKSIKIFMTNKKAWKLEDTIKSNIKSLIEVM